MQLLMWFCSTVQCNFCHKTVNWWRFHGNFAMTLMWYLLQFPPNHHQGCIWFNFQTRSNLTFLPYLLASNFEHVRNLCIIMATYFPETAPSLHLRFSLQSWKQQKNCLVKWNNNHCTSYAHGNRLLCDLVTTFHDIFHSVLTITFFFIFCIWQFENKVLGLKCLKHVVDNMVSCIVFCSKIDQFKTGCHQNNVNFS